MPLMLIQARIHLRIIQLPTPLADTLEQQRLRIELRINPKNIQDDPRGRPIIARPNNISVADDEDKLALVVVVEDGERVDCAFEGFFAFGIAWDLADDEFVEEFWLSLRAELQGGED